MDLVLKEVSAFVKELGFPVFVACFLLLKINPTLKKLEIVLEQILLYFKNSSLPK